MALPVVPSRLSMWPLTYPTRVEFPMQSTVEQATGFLVTDAGLRRYHGPTYDDVGRWLFAGAVVLGGVVGSLTALAEGALAVSFAFLAGAVVCNVLKEELSDPESARLAAFLVGALGYTTILLFV